MGPLHGTTPRTMGTTPLWDSCYKPKPIPRRWTSTDRRRFRLQSSAAIRTWCSDYGKYTAREKNKNAQPSAPIYPPRSPPLSNSLFLGVRTKLRCLQTDLVTGSSAPVEPAARIHLATAHTGSPKSRDKPTPDTKTSSSHDICTGYGLHTHLHRSQVALQAVDNDGWTALHYAAWHGYDTIVGQLLQAKANPTAVDKDGRTALQLAEQRGKQDVVQRLRQVHSP